MMNIKWIAGAALVAAAAVVGITLLPAKTASATPEIGKPAPEFRAVDSRGVTRALSDYRGDKVILEWTNHDCPYVRKHYNSGNMQALQKDAADDGVVWLSIISSAPGKQGHVDGAGADKLTASRNARPSAVLLDPSGKVGRLYDARTTPHMFVIDEDGTLVYAGGIDDRPSSRLADIDGATNYVRQALTELGEGKAVSVTVSRPYGCSVKYP